jgi:hypothetical protein
MMQDVHVKLNPVLPRLCSIQQEADYFHQQIGLKFREETRIAFHGAETWTLWKIDKKYPESFEMWCWEDQLDQLCEE